MTVVLSVRDLSVNYGHLVALRNLDLTVDAGEVVAVIGANGAGKSSMVRGVLGLAARTVAELTGPGGVDLRRASTRTAIRSGIGVVPERRRVFGGQSVEANLLLGASVVRDRKRVRTTLAEVLELFPDLVPLLGRRAGALSGGEQQMLAVGRGLMSRPKLLIMDEPSLGLAPVLASRMFDDIRRISAGGVGVLVAEENATRSLAIADSVVVLEVGRTVAGGTPQQVAQDAAIHSAYLGGGRP